jgi:tRNA threonylcarbamoyladenosine biosynthesis protein TsaE
MREWITTTPEESADVARAIAGLMRPGDLIAVTGPIGAGKTLMAQAFAEALGITETITSPSFTILEEYDAPTPFYHFDFYRIASPDELDNLGFDEYFNGGGVCWIEWAELAAEALPPHRYQLTIHVMNETTRRITLEHTAH